jgi:hypothetical protein
MHAVRLARFSFVAGSRHLICWGLELNRSRILRICIVGRLPQVEEPLPPGPADALRTFYERLRKPVVVMWHGSWLHHTFPKLVLCVKVGRGGMTMSTPGSHSGEWKNDVLYDVGRSPATNAWRLRLHP